MGGLALFLAVSVPFLILSDYSAISVAAFGTAIACAALGFVDDWTKLRSALAGGLGPQQLIIQALIAIALWLMATEYVGLTDTSGCGCSTRRWTLASSTRC